MSLSRPPRAWYDNLSEYLLTKGYIRGNADKTLFIKKGFNDILLVQIYMHDIVFGSRSKKLVDEFVETMTKQFRMSMFGNLHCFLELQVT